MAKPAGGSVMRTANSPPMRSTVNEGGGAAPGLEAVPEDSMKLVPLDAERWRHRRVRRDGLPLVRVQGDQDFLVDQQTRPAHQRAHPLAQAVRQAEVDAVPRHAVQRLPPPPQRQQLLAQVDQGGQGAVQVAVLIEEVPALRAEPAEPAAEHVLAEHQVRAAGRPPLSKPCSDP